MALLRSAGSLGAWENRGVRRWILSLLVVLGVGGLLVWGLSGPSGGRPGGAALSTGGGGEAGGAPAVPAPISPEPAGPALAGRPVDPAARGPEWPVVPSDSIPRGGLDVAVLEPDGTPFPLAGVNLKLVRQGADFWAEPIPRRDEDHKVFSYRNLVWGKVTVHVWGDHIVHATREADVPNGEVQRVEVFADRGGSVHWRGTLPDEKAPESVTVTLLDAKTKRPVAVHHQTRLADALTNDVRTATVTLPPDGWAFAIPPGDYVLHATSKEGDTEDVPVHVAIDETSEVEIPFRY